MFKKDFDDYVMDGDYITCEVDGFTIRATLYHDTDTAPAEKGDYPPDVIEAWENDEWHYYGVAVTVWKGDVRLTGTYDHATWGIEGNYPSKDKIRNAYFRAVANDYLPEALADAKAKVAAWAKELN